MIQYLGMLEQDAASSLTLIHPTDTEHMILSSAIYCLIYSLSLQVSFAVYEKEIDVSSMFQPHGMWTLGFVG